MNGIDDRAIEIYYSKPEAKPVHICSNCDEPIFEGQDYYDIPNDGIYCEDCVRDWKFTARRD